MEEQINKIQMLQFELIKESSFNSFDGKQVVNDLLKNRDLWRGVIMDREGYHSIDLIKLRDIEDEVWNVDTIFILCSGKDDNKLLELTKSWEADEVSFMDEAEASNCLGTSHPNGKILKVWWD